MDLVAGAIGDAKSAKTVRETCKKHTRGSSNQGKRPRLGLDTESEGQPLNKRARFDRTPALGRTVTEENLQDTEPEVILDLELLASTRVYTNRAPLLLAFAFELIRFTMPEQPVSSRFSLSQAVVSLNAQSKAARYGQGGRKEPLSSSWRDGQPKVVILGRQIPVLRRDGYTHSTTSLDSVPPSNGTSTTPLDTREDGAQPGNYEDTTSPPLWVVSQALTFRESTFVARIASLSNAADGPKLVRQLVESNHELSNASHNSWGLRVTYQRASHGTELSEPVQKSDDDGETGCGKFILNLLSKAQLDNVIVVISRWFGGVLLGPQRWSLIQKCCDEAILERLRQTGQSGPDGKVALWALDEGEVDRLVCRSSAAPGNDMSSTGLVVGAAVFRPKAARDYLGRSFLSTVPETQSTRGAAGRKGSIVRGAGSSSEHNMTCVLGAIRILLDSWKDHLSVQEMDARAWTWYASVRPQVESGPGGWGQKGWVNLKNILALRHQEAT